MDKFSNLRSSKAELLEEYKIVENECNKFVANLVECSKNSYGIEYVCLSGEKAYLENEYAKSLAKVYDGLTEENRKRFEMLAVSSPKGLEYLVSFADAQNAKG